MDQFKGITTVLAQLVLRDNMVKNNGLYKRCCSNVAYLPRIPHGYGFPDEFRPDRVDRFWDDSPRRVKAEADPSTRLLHSNICSTELNALHHSNDRAL